MRAQRIIARLLEAEDDIDLKRYMADVPERLFREIIPELQKLGWEYKPTNLSDYRESYFKKTAADGNVVWRVWVYSYEARLHAYGSIKKLVTWHNRRNQPFEDWREGELPEIEQETDESVADFASMINEYATTAGQPEDVFNEAREVIEAVRSNFFKREAFRLAHKWNRHAFVSKLREFDIHSPQVDAFVSYSPAQDMRAEHSYRLFGYYFGYPGAVRTVVDRALKSLSVITDAPIEVRQRGGAAPVNTVEDWHEFTVMLPAFYFHNPMN